MKRYCTLFLIIFGIFHARMTAGQKFSSPAQYDSESEGKLKAAEKLWARCTQEYKQYLIFVQNAPDNQEAKLKELNLAEREQACVKGIIEILNTIMIEKALSKNEYDKCLSAIDYLEKDLTEKQTVLQGVMVQMLLGQCDLVEDTNIGSKKIEIGILEKEIGVLEKQIKQKKTNVEDLKAIFDPLLEKDKRFMARKDLLDWEIFRMKKNLGLNQGIETLYCSKDFPSNLQKIIRDRIVHGNEEFFLTILEKAHRILPTNIAMDIDTNNRCIGFFGLDHKRDPQAYYLPVYLYGLRLYPPMSHKEHQDALRLIFSLEEQKEREKNFLNNNPYLKGALFRMIFFIVRDANSAWIEDMEKYFSELECEKGCKNGFNPEGLCEKGYRFAIFSHSKDNKNKEIENKEIENKEIENKESGEKTTNLNDLSDQIKGFVKDLMKEKNL
ncbi:MAG: hypothetical protein FJX00_00645 [Alphaproteobacteria bacterium]|nr:hypothetical protein [Alphaproteobacteria bacterium]